MGRLSVRPGSLPQLAVGPHCITPGAFAAQQAEADEAGREQRQRAGDWYLGYRQVAAIAGGAAANASELQIVVAGIE